MKRENPIPENKIKAVQELESLAKNKKTILIASIKNIPGSQFQEIVKKLRGKAIVKVPKKSLIMRALGSEEEGMKNLKQKIKDSFVILFSDLDGFELAGELIKNRSPAKAKAGQIAENDIEIPEGPTELIPGPAVSELSGLGIKIQIEKGKITIKEPKIVAKKGEKISEGASSIMAKLDIKPFKIGFIPLCSFDTKENKFYAEIKIDREETIEELKRSYGKALPFALERGYVTEETIKLMISKASSQEKRLIRVISGEPEEVEIKEETPKEDKKEEPKVDATAGLASLFG